MCSLLTTQCVSDKAGICVTVAATEPAQRESLTDGASGDDQEEGRKEEEGKGGNVARVTTY